MKAGYFEKFKFTPAQIGSYLSNAEKDLAIALKTDIQDVKFTYSYNVLLKAGIYIIAKNKGMKAKSMPGHHVAILQALGEILEDEKFFAIADAMRMKRNLDLYQGGIQVTEKESNDYCKFAADVLKKVKAL